MQTAPILPKFGNAAGAAESTFKGTEQTSLWGDHYTEPAAEDSIPGKFSGSSGDVKWKAHDMSARRKAIAQGQFSSTR